MIKTNTKEARLEVRKYTFAKLIENGYNRETYKEVDFFTKEDGKYYTLKVYRGTSANHELYINYRTAEDRSQAVKNIKDNYDRRQAYKAEQKEQNKGKSSSHAGASASIKAELKKAFPNTKFSVTSDSFSGGNSVHISWTDGATVEEVEVISAEYQYGSFDGMNDIYNYTNTREDIPQVKYVQERREISEELIKEVTAELMKVRAYSEEQINSYRDNPTQEARQILYNTSIPHNYTSLRLAENKEGRSYIDFYVIEFETPQEVKAEDNEKTEYTEITANKGEINIVDYSEKAFAIIGDTKPIKDKLKALGGSFNPRLSCGAGWIFSKKKLEEVTTALKQKEEAPKQVEVIEVEAEEVKEIEEPTTTALTFYKNEQPKHYDNIQDIDTAVSNGEVISLCNLFELVNG